MTEEKQKHEPVSAKDTIRQLRLQKLAECAERGINPYPYSFAKDAKAAELQEKYKDLPADTETEDVYSVAGRVMAIRNTGMFIDLMDDSGKIQIFSHKQNLPEDQIKLLKMLDIGDMVGFTGKIRRTPRGELSIKSTDIKLLAKALLPLPEKFHGLTDVETRYRQRYVDMIVNDEVRDTFRKRSLIIQKIREFLNKQDFLEVETPMLHPQASGANARPFVTHHNTLDMDMTLRIAPELYLKRLMVGGLSEKIFEINRSFRNEGIDIRHNPEFTMIELYQAYVDYNEMMVLLENMVSYVAKEVLGTTKIQYGEHEIDLTPPWDRKTMLGAIKEYTGIDLIEELAGDSNPSNKADSFLFRVEVRMETFVEVNTYKRLDTEYRKFTDYQKLHYKFALLEQALYVFKNSDISVDSGYDPNTGIIANKNTLKSISLAPNARNELILCGLFDRHIRSKRSIEWGTWWWR